MRNAFRDEVEFILKSVFFWFGLFVILLVNISITYQNNFNNVLSYFEFTYKSQFFTFLVAILGLALGLSKEKEESDLNGLPSKSALWGKIFADTLILSLALLLTTLPKFIIREIQHGGFSDPALVGTLLKCFFIYYFLQGVSLMFATAVASHCFMGLVTNMPFTAIIGLSFTAILFPIGAGWYADLVRAFTENRLVGSYTEILLTGETKILLTSEVLWKGLASLALIIALLVVIILLTYHVYNKEIEKYNDYHSEPEVSNRLS